MKAPERPKLRADLTWRRFVSEGEDSYIFKDEITQAYVKLDTISGSLALRLDGQTSLAELLDWARATWTSLDFDADYIADVVSDLRRYRFIEDPFLRNAMLRARAREERAQINASTFKNLSSIAIGTVDPDRFLTRTYPRVRFLFTPTAIASPTATHRPPPACSGPVGLADTNSKLTARSAYASPWPYSAPSAMTAPKTS